MPIQPKNDTAIKADTITEKTTDAGVEIEGTLFENDYIDVDTATEPAAPSAGIVRLYEEGGILHARNANHSIQLTEGSPIWCGTTGGTANVQTASATQAPNAYYAGMTISFIGGVANTSTATININSLGAKALRDQYGNACIGGEISVGGMYTAIYNGTDFYILNPTRTWVSYSPTYTAGGTMGWGSITTAYAEYLKIGRSYWYRVKATGTTSGSAHTDLMFTLPATPNEASTEEAGGVWTVSTGTIGGGIAFTTSSNRMIVRKYDSSSWGIGASTGFSINGFFRST